MELDTYFYGAGQCITFRDSGHQLIIGLATDGSTYLDKDSWLPVDQNEKSATITVSKIGNYNEPAREVYELVKADLLVLQSKFNQLVSECDISIVLNFDITMLDGVVGKREFGLWLVNELKFSIRSKPDSLEYRYMNDNMAANLYLNAQSRLRTTTDESKIAKLQSEMKRQVRNAFVFTIKLTNVTDSSTDGARRLKRRKIVIDDDDEL
jgi:hypothetical protein